MSKKILKIKYKVEETAVIFQSLLVADEGIDEAINFSVQMDTLRAKHISHCVNNFDDLMDACENLVRAAEAIPSPNPFLGTKDFNNAKSMIAKGKLYNSR